MDKATGRATAPVVTVHRGGVQNPIGSISLIALAFGPQLLVLAFWFARSVLALIPGNEALFGPFAAGPAFDIVSGLLADRTLLTVYSLPLVLIAIFTLFPRLKGAQDYYGGVALIAVALFAFWASNDLNGMRGFSFGPGTAPRMFAALLAALGIAVAAGGLVTDGAPLARFAWRGPFFVTVSVLLFAVAIRPLGLIVSGIITFLVAAMGSPETRWLEAVIVGVALTAFCAVLFPFMLGLSFQLWPQFLQ
ncbi:tripartite tricarboxylate transporter TctB family protein [Bradyrhizobium sp. 2TAF24]|uniref:tripartite tricarboxylate transporter TctB family protein n=1 Tax=Bradyrhizobium sp. 2TAF24 TaxID=3233011 RepID=UPI003F91EE8B